MLPVAACAIAIVMFSSSPVGTPVAHKASHKPKHKTIVRSLRRPHPLAPTTPTLPFYLSLSPGDTYTPSGGTAYTATRWSGVIPMSAGDQVTTLSPNTVGPSLIITQDGHTLALMANTTVMAHPADTTSGNQSSNVPYLTITSAQGGVIASSGYLASASGPRLSIHGKTKPAAKRGKTATNPVVKVVVKTSGATTGVFGSSFAVFLQGPSTSQSTYVEDFDATSVTIGTAATLFTAPSSGMEYVAGPNGAIVNLRGNPIPVPAQSMVGSHTGAKKKKG